MADYAKIEVEVVASENDDYSDPYYRRSLDAYEITPEQGFNYQKISASTSGTTVEFGVFPNSMSLLIVKNLDSTNYVSLRIRDAGATTDAIRVQPGGIFITTDIIKSIDLIITANSAAVDCEVIACGA